MSSISTCSSLLLVLSITVAACGGSTSTATATTPIAPTETTTKAASGTSGLPGLDWGASADVVRAVYPNASPGEGGLYNLGAVEGHPSNTKFTIGAGGLDAVNTEWTEGLVSMAECSKTWQEIRTSLDGRFGPSQSDNLAAYWKTPTASITLACNPNDAGAGVLSLNYSHLDDQ